MKSAERIQTPTREKTQPREKRDTAQGDSSLSGRRVETLIREKPGLDCDCDSEITWPSRVVQRVCLSSVYSTETESYNDSVWPQSLLSRPGAATVAMRDCEITVAGSQSSTAAVSVNVNIAMESLGQLHYQCSRCLIIYQHSDQIEKHIGQFHMSTRSVDDEPFELTDDNFHTFVKTCWEANLNSTLYSGFIARPKLPSFSEPNYYDAVGTNFECGRQLPGAFPTQLPILTASDLRGFLEPIPVNKTALSTVTNSQIPSGALIDLEPYLDMDSDDNESLWDCTSPSSPCSILSFDLSNTESLWDCTSPSSPSSIRSDHLSPEMRIEMEMPARLPEPKFPSYFSEDEDDDDQVPVIPSRKQSKKVTSVSHSSKQHRKIPKKKQGLYKHSKTSSGYTKATLKDASRKVNAMMHMITDYAKDEKKKQKAMKKKLESSGDFGEPKDLAGKVLPQRGASKGGKGKKNMRKCRGVYGINNQMNWCNMCKWKKRCSRFGDEDEDLATTPKEGSEVAE